MATVKDFDGTGDHVQVVNPTGIDPASSWFWGVWAVYDSLGGSGSCIFRVGEDSATTTRGIVCYISAFDKVTIYEPVSNVTFLENSVSQDTWFRVGGRWSPGTWPNWVLNGSSSSSGGFVTDPVALQAGDALVFGEATKGLGGTERSDWNGGIGFSFWVNLTDSGDLPSASELDAYLQDPQSLLDDFGATGSIEAGACKVLWGFCEAGNATDESGTGNTGVVQGSDGTRIENPTDYPSFDPCGASASNVPGLYNYRRRQRMAI